MTIWTAPATDAAGRAFVVGSSVLAIDYLNCNEGSFADPTGKTHWGAAKDGKFYVGGAPCAAGAFSVEGQANIASWRYHGIAPQALSFDGNKEVRFDELAGHTGGAKLILHDGAPETGFPGILKIANDLRWWLQPTAGIVDVMFDAFALSLGTKLRFAMELRRSPTNAIGLTKEFTDGTNTSYVFYQIINGVRTETVIDTDVNTSGGIRIERDISGLDTVRLYKRPNLTDPWAQIGEVDGYDVHACLEIQPVYLHFYLTGDQASTGSIILLPFTPPEDPANVSTYASWTMTQFEATTHRGAQFTMPDKLVAVSTSESISLIDPDADGGNGLLWLRALVGEDLALANNFGFADARPVSAHWQNGKLIVCVSGSRQTIASEMHEFKYLDDKEVNLGAVVLDFVEDAIYIHKSVTRMPDDSIVLGGIGLVRNFWGPFPYRNELPAVNYPRWDTNTGNGYRGLMIPDSRVNHCASYLDVLHTYTAFATSSGIGLFKRRSTEISKTGLPSTGNNQAAMTYCEFDAAGTLFYMDPYTLFSASKEVWETSFAAGVIENDGDPTDPVEHTYSDVTYFEAEIFRQLPFAFSLPSQHRFVLHGSDVLFATNNLIYRVTWPRGQFVPTYGASGFGASYGLLPSDIGIITCINKRTQTIGGVQVPVLVIAATGTTAGARQIALVDLDKNQLIGVQSVSTSLLPIGATPIDIA
jgi:hypothetical protein